MNAPSASHLIPHFKRIFGELGEAAMYIVLVPAAAVVEVEVLLLVGDNILPHSTVFFSVEAQASTFVALSCFVDCPFEDFKIGIKLHIESCANVEDFGTIYCSYRVKVHFLRGEKRIALALYSVNFNNLHIIPPMISTYLGEFAHLT